MSYQSQNPYGSHWTGQPLPQPPRKKSRTKPLLFGCLGAIALLLVIIAIAAVATSNNGSQASTVSSTPTQVQSHATAKPTIPKPKSTPQATTAPVQTIPATFGRPVLGGPVSDFVGKFGQPNSHSTSGEIYHFDRIPGQNLDGVIVTPYPGTQQADDITVQTPDPGWTASDAENHCLAYAPLDYKFKQKIPYADNTGYDMVYSSVSLAKAFPVADFSDGNGNAVAPGMFDISYLYASDNQHIGSCDLIIGEQQTNG